jgi:hypothetical protein
MSCKANLRIVIEVDTYSKIKKLSSILEADPYIQLCSSPKEGFFMRAIFIRAVVWFKISLYLNSLS